MPFQSEKQRRYLHANHPEIAKRWERDYANGGISNHFRRKFFTGALADTQGPAGGQAMSLGTSTTGGSRNLGGGQGNQGNQGNQGGGDGPIHPIHQGPTAAEIEAEKKAIADAEHKAWIDRKDKKKKKVDWVNKNLENVDAGFKLKNFATSLNPLDLLKPNLPLIGVSYLYNKLKNKKKDNIETSALDVDENIKVAKLSVKQIKEYKALDLKKKMNESGVGPPLTNEEKKELERLEKEKESKLTTDTGTAFVANGGILDIDASEEIISDDGNDIELTAYNAEFDDPKDLSTGVKTLFQAKDGGRIGFANGPPGGGDPGMYSAPSSDRGPRDAPDRYGPAPKSSPVGDYKGQHDWSVGTKPGEGEVVIDIGSQKEEPYVMVGGQKVHQSLWGTSADPREKYDSEEQMLDLTYAFNPTGATKKHTYITNKKKAAYEKSLADQKAKLKKMGMGKLIKALALLLVGMPPEMVMKQVMISPNEIKTLIEDSIPVMQAKKDYTTALGNAKADYETLGMAKFHHAVDTEIQTIDQTLLDLTKPKDKEEKGDGPEPPVVIPVKEEIDAYAQSDYSMSPWERIKANQAKRAMLVEKGVIQENPVVDESVTDIVMEANRGGLANLFRVKNQ